MHNFKRVNGRLILEKPNTKQSSSRSEYLFYRIFKAEQLNYIENIIIQFQNPLLKNMICTFRDVELK